jgi:hypothetical protein
MYATYPREINSLRYYTCKTSAHGPSAAPPPFPMLALLERYETIKAQFRPRCPLVEQRLLTCSVTVKRFAVTGLRGLEELAEGEKGAGEEDVAGKKVLWTEL